MDEDDRGRALRHGQAVDGGLLFDSPPDDRHRRIKSGKKMLSDCYTNSFGKLQLLVGWGWSRQHAGDRLSSLRAMAASLGSAEVADTTKTEAYCDQVAWAGSLRIRSKKLAL